jgi:hypothetical protein
MLKQQQIVYKTRKHLSANLQIYVKDLFLLLLKSPSRFLYSHLRSFIFYV